LICLVAALSLAGCATTVACDAKDPQGVFFAQTVGTGRDAHIENGQLIYRPFSGTAEIRYSVRRPASYTDDPRCTGPDGTGGTWMAANPDEGLWFFIVPDRGRSVTVNQLLPK
jgi:hypothetical protein